MGLSRECIFSRYDGEVGGNYTLISPAPGIKGIFVEHNTALGKAIANAPCFPNTAHACGSGTCCINKIDDNGNKSGLCADLNQACSIPIFEKIDPKGISSLGSCQVYPEICNKQEFCNNNGVCVKKRALGQTCSANAECGDGFCDIGFNTNTRVGRCSKKTECRPSDTINQVGFECRTKFKLPNGREVTQYCGNDNLPVRSQSNTLSKTG